MGDERELADNRVCAARLKSGLVAATAAHKKH